MLFVLISALIEVGLRARRVAELVALRLVLPSRLERTPLDELLAELSPAPRSARASDLNCSDLLRAERGLARIPWVPSTCLYQALARYALLRRSGADPTFVMAVDKRGIAQNGHAWVEVHGRSFEETSDVTGYTVTFRYRRVTSARRAEVL